MRAALVLAVAVLASAGTAHAAPGDLDPTYAEDGWRTIDFAGDDERGRAVAIAPDGAILVAGGASGDFALVRSSADGSSFVPQTTDFGGDNDDANGLAFQGFGGKLVVAGFTNSPGPERHFATARYNADLALDRTFSGDGRQTTDLGADAAAIAVAVHPAPDYRIVQVGPGQIGSGDDFALARHRVSGAPDPAFGGGDGWLTSDLGGVDQANAVAIDAGGRIVVAGATGFDFAVARYRAIDGAPDTSFSPLGHRATDFGGAPDAAYGVAIQSDGKIVVVGHAGSDLALARYHENGTPDTSFSADGKQTTDFGEAAIGRAVAVQPDGRIVVAGAALSSSSSDFDFALARYNPDGTLDTSFSGDGRKTTDLGSNDLAAALALQPDGKIVLAGSSESDASVFAVARYEGTPPDSDGDGVPDAGDACPAVAAATANGCPAPVAPLIPIPVPAPPAGGATAGPDVFVGAAGVRNVFRAGAGDDRLTGGPLADLLCGEAGGDRIDGGGGADRLYGDSCPGARLAAAAGEGDDVIRGGSGNDRLVGSGGNDRLTGGAGADRMDGGAGRDKLSGGAGDDRLTGGAGNDALAGGAGRNRYAGGAGNDRLSAANGRKDRVDCGAGRRDSAVVDRRDRVKGCEKVRRRR